MDQQAINKLPFRVLADGKKLSFSPPAKHGFVVNREDRVVFIGTPEMAKFVVSATATLLEELEALKTWRSALTGQSDVADGIEISISKIETCLTEFVATTETR